MTASDKLARLLDVIQSGKTVYISTALRSTKVTAKDVAKFDRIGRPLFKADSKSLYMSVGKRYDCIDYCQFTVQS